MNRMILNLLMQNLMARRAGRFQIRRVSPWAGLVVVPVFGLLAVVGLVGFAALSVFFLVFSLVRSFLPGPKAARPETTRAEPTITVLDAAGNTVAHVSRGA